MSEENPLIYWISDDIDASIKEEVKDLINYFIVIGLIEYLEVS